MIFWISFCLVFLPIILLFPTKVVGKKKFPKRKKQNVIVCCNHTSNLDGPLIDVKFKKKIYYLGKIELFKNKFVGFFLKKYGAIPVDRNKVDITAIKTTLKLLKDGKNVGIFPQGTRGEEGKIDENTVKDGVAMFSLRTGVPVLPMVIVKKPKIFRRNLIMVGDLIFPDTEKAKDKDYKEEFTKNIITKLNELLDEGEKRLCKKKWKICQ